MLVKIAGGFGLLRPRDRSTGLPHARIGLVLLFGAVVFSGPEGSVQTRSGVAEASYLSSWKTDVVVSNQARGPLSAHDARQQRGPLGVGSTDAVASAEQPACPPLAQGPNSPNPTSPFVRGCFLAVEGRVRPFVDAVVSLPGSSDRAEVRFLVDTGSDITVVAPRDAARLGIEYELLPVVQRVSGVGGPMDARFVNATVVLASVVVPVALTLVDPNTAHSTLSLLGRDVLGQFALFVDEPHRRVLLYEPHAARALVP